MSVTLSYSVELVHKCWETTGPAGGHSRDILRTVHTNAATVVSL